MKFIQSTFVLAAVLVSSCDQKQEKTSTAEQHVEGVNPFIGEWMQVTGNKTIKFVSQGDSILFYDGQQNFKAVPSGESSINVDLTSILLGIVVFEYSKEDDSVVAMGDKFKRK